MGNDNETGELPQKMRAWTYTKRGPPSSVLSLSDVPLPKLSSPNDILIKVSHASLNPVGSFLIAILPAFVRNSPTIPELDFSGTVVRTGASVRPDIKPGVAVFGSVPPMYNLRKKIGALAEYVVVPETSIAIKSESLGFDAAAGFGVTGVTALELVHDAKLKEGDSVLINGASGGVGTLTVQVARSVVGPTGKIVAICSGQNAGLVKELGADEIVDRKEHDPVHEYLARTYKDAPFSAVIDAVGIQSIYDHSPQYLSDQGMFVSVGVQAEELNLASTVRAMTKIASNLYWPRILGGVSRPYIQKTVTIESSGLEKLLALSESSQLTLILDSTFQMEDALKAYEKILSHRATGKICIAMSAK